MSSFASIHLLYAGGAQAVHAHGVGVGAQREQRSGSSAAPSTRSSRAPGRRVRGVQPADGHGPRLPRARRAQYVPRRPGTPVGEQRSVTYVRIEGAGAGGGRAEPAPLTAGKLHPVQTGWTSHPYRSVTSAGSGRCPLSSSTATSAPGTLRASHSPCCRGTSTSVAP